jgi:benzoate/toluate 1,2-dioxygenase beta subunit/2,4,5-trichlorophenoxyacetic acid oxygenase 2
MYHDSRESLAERIVRLRSGRTVTAMPLPRTTHLISGVLAREAGAGRIEASASWTTMIYFPRTSAQHALFGRAEHLLEERDGAWRIRRKKAILMNDRVPAAIDFYCL